MSTPNSSKTERESVPPHSRQARAAASLDRTRSGNGREVADELFIGNASAERHSAAGDRLGGVAPDERSRRDRLRHHAAGADDRAGPDGDVGKDDDAWPDIHVVLDADRLLTPEPCARSGIPEMADDDHAHADADVVPDRDQTRIRRLDDRGQSDREVVAGG